MIIVILKYSISIDLGSRVVIVAIKTLFVIILS